MLESGPLPGPLRALSLLLLGACAGRSFTPWGSQGRHLESPGEVGTIDVCGPRACDAPGLRYVHYLTWSSRWPE